MRSIRIQPEVVKTKVGVLTGGIKENKPQIELNIGDLVKGTNYQEIDGGFHGYMSLAGYEIYSGEPLASSIPVASLEDKGNDNFTELLLENRLTSNPRFIQEYDIFNEFDILEGSEIEDHSYNTVAVAVESVVSSTYNSDDRFTSSWKFIDPINSLISFPSYTFSNKDFCIDVRFSVEDSITDTILYDNSGVLSFRVSASTRKLTVVCNEGDITEKTKEFDTVLFLDTYYTVSLRRIGNVLYANIDGTDEPSAIYFGSTPYEFLTNSDPATFKVKGWFSQYRISIGTHRRPAGNYTIIETPYTDSSYYYLTYEDLERELTRESIDKINGSGGILGCLATRSNEVYAVRDSEDALEGKVWKSSNTGWVEVTNDTDTLDPNGKYKFIEAAFDLLPGLQRVRVPIFVSGVDSPCYINTITNKFVKITHADLPVGIYPTSIVEFKNRLWLGYSDGRVCFSNVGDPTDFNSTTFAGTIYLEDKVLDFAITVGDALVVLCENSISIIKALTSTSVTDQVLVDYLFSKEQYSSSGGYQNTLQRIFDDIFYIDKSGLVSVSSSQSFGSFQSKSYSKGVQKTLSANTNKIVCSLTSPKYNQYRLFFNDGYGIIFTFTVQNETKIVKGATTFKYLFNPTCCSSNDEMLIAGDSEGNVFLLDSGTSFNGEVIDTFLKTSYHHYNSPTLYKHFLSVNIEGSIPYNLDLNVSANFDYRNTNFIPQSNIETLDFKDGMGSSYGTGVYGSIRYASSENQTPVFYVNAYGTNMSIGVTTSNKYTDPHTLSSLISQYSIKGRRI